MTRSISLERTALSLSRAPVGTMGRVGATVVALVVGGWLAVGFPAPVQAQWIGTPGGTGDAAAEAPAAESSAAPVTITVPSGSSSPSASGGQPSVSNDMTNGFTGGFTPAPGGMAPAQVDSGPDPKIIADCKTNVESLRDGLESSNATLRKAADKKVPPSELCPLFRNFVTAQQKFYNYLNKNKTKCGVPPEVLTSLKKNSGQVASIRDKVCQAAQMEKNGGGGGPPPQGALSSGLGLSNSLPPTATAKGGVFDTLGGDALR